MKKAPTNEQVEKAVSKYLEKHMGEGVSSEEASNGYILTAPNGMTLVIGDDLHCVLDGSPSPLTEKELRGYILEMAEDAPDAPRTEGKEAKAIMPSQGRKFATSQMVASCDTVLTPEKVRDYFCKTATPEECMFALEVCKIRGLNPFKRDCFFIKYGGADPKLEIVVAKDYFMKNALAHPDFESFRAGVTVKKGEEISNVERYYAYPGEELIGGWAEVKRKSMPVPFKAEIPLSGFKKDNKFWNSQPGAGHMIRKCAGGIVLREAFEEFAGLYDEVEMGLDPSREVAA